MIIAEKKTGYYPLLVKLIKFIIEIFDRFIVCYLFEIVKWKRIDIVQ